MAIEVSFSNLANKGQNASTTGKAGKTVLSAKGAAPAVTLEYLMDGIKNGSKEPAFPRQLGDAILNGLAGKEGRPARMNGQDVSEGEVYAYTLLPASVRGAIKFEPAVPAVAGMSALIVSGNIHNALLEKAEAAETEELNETDETEELNEASETDGGELDDFLK